MGKESRDGSVRVRGNKRKLVLLERKEDKKEKVENHKEREKVGKGE